MRVFVPRGRLPLSRDVPSALTRVAAVTGMRVYSGVEALKDLKLKRLDEGRRRR